MDILKHKNGREFIVIRPETLAYWLDTQTISRINPKHIIDVISEASDDIIADAENAVEEYNIIRREYQNKKNAENSAAGKTRKTRKTAVDTPPALDTPLGAIHHLFMDTSIPVGTSEAHKSVLLLSAIKQIVERFADRYELADIELTGSSVLDIEQTGRTNNSALETIKAMNLSETMLNELLAGMK